MVASPEARLCTRLFSQAKVTSGTSLLLLAVINGASYG